MAQVRVRRHKAESAAPQPCGTKQALNAGLLSPLVELRATVVLRHLRTELDMRVADADRELCMSSCRGEEWGTQ